MNSRRRPLAAGRAWFDVDPCGAAAFAASIPDSKDAGNRPPAPAIKSRAPIHGGAMVREADDDAKAALMTGRARLFFQIAAARCGKGSAIMASNPGFGAWGQAIAGDRAPAAAMPDRLLRHSHAARILGESRRPKGTRRAGIVGPAKEKNAVAI